ncbi:ATP-binding cassette domain-containing protein [Conexibacter stalactiti]|uniref:ATP-binding cassette domain-containing protein n=1 Tax=Conexibacter stalactiti TaxID=1940611 RepID=A0ABU4HXN0_9ACTN|nr:ATP-binding cassette domain-containing protein [Conexibacter stalactiti]MDW5597442.1 ATP-binding cassette domain-containing protein [Conexibacter stalactiti]MEC5038084.1 ATP-binding cassette domain-containing protein [Conexibacter stalactiti]
MLAVEGLTKRYRGEAVVDDLSFSATAGRVTGFLGPNGAGKTQTIKMILGLVQPTAGRVLIDGRELLDHARPGAVASGVLDGGAFHPGRRVLDELSLQAFAAGVCPDRAPELLDRVGLAPAARARIGTLSLGMRQRLALARALLSDAPLLIADEPANGLDPAGMHWLRQLLRELAEEGKTVLVSSHLLAEMERFADDVVVIAHGRLVADGPIGELRAVRERLVRVRCANARVLGARLRARGLTIVADEGDELVVGGGDARTIGEIALLAQIAIHRLVEDEDGLEERYLALTAEAQPRDAAEAGRP